MWWLVSRNESFDKDLDALRKEYRQLMPMKLSDIAAIWGHIRQTKVDEQSFGNLYRHCHSLAGSASTFGFVEVGSCARAVENLLAPYLDALPTTFDAETSKVIDMAIRKLHDAVKSPALEGDDHEDSHEWLSSRGEAMTASFDEKASVLYWYGRDVVLAQRARVYLGYFGYRVTVFEERAAFQKAIAETPPDVVVVDPLPRGQEIEAVEEILPEPMPKIPTLVFCSHGGDLKIWLKAVRAGAGSCLVKPVHFLSLLEKLEGLLHERDLQPYRLMVVDDDLTLAKHVSAIMKKAGMEVCVVEQPYRIMREMERFQPDLILMDLYMPEFSGMELAKVIRAHDEYMSIPIVYMSSETGVNKKLEALDVGADDFLLKPIKYRYLYFSLLSRMKRARALRDMMVRDHLTGLANHLSFWKTFTRETVQAAAEDRRLVFCIIDLDGFGTFGEGAGVQTGDAVIRSLGLLLRRRLNDKALLGRYAGKQFGVLFRNTGIGEVRRLMEQLRQDFSQIGHEDGDRVFYMTVSIGVAPFDVFPSASELAVAAERGVHRAKALGSNRVVLIEDDPREKVRTIDLDESSDLLMVDGDSVEVPMDEFKGLVEDEEDEAFLLDFDEPPVLEEMVPVPETSENKKRIIVVDDEQSILDLVAGFLRKNGFDVVAVNTGEAALASAREKKPDLILTDLLLFPGIHGFELCRQVRNDAALHRIKLMVMTGVYKKYRYRLEARDAGVDEFVEKPIDFDDMLIKVSRLTGDDKKGR